MSLEAKLASVQCDLRREAQHLIRTTESLIASEQARSQSLVLALSEVRASSEEQQAHFAAQIEVQTERADHAEALVATKARLLADERASSISLALENMVCEERLKLQEENSRSSAAKAAQLVDDIHLLRSELDSQHARHEAKIAELEQNCSAQSQLLQATRNTCDLTVSSLRKQLQQEADQKRATYQVQQQLQEQVLDLVMQRQIEHESVDSVEKELAQAQSFFNNELENLRSQILAAQDNVRHIGGTCNALTGETRQAVAAHAAAVEARELVEQEVRDLRQATSSQHDRIASLESQLQQASMPGGVEGGCSPGPHAEEPSNPNQGLPDWESDTSEEACQQTMFEDALDPDEQEDSEVRDTTTHGELGVMRFFKPMTMPERPEGLEFAGNDEIQVAQLASHQWHHRNLAVLEHHGIAWTGSWSLAPLSCAPGVFVPSREALALIGKGTFGKVHFGQRWTGGGDPSAPQIGWAKGWEAVAIKVVETSPSARQEVDSLQKLQSGFPGEPHVIQLLESHTYKDETSGISWTYIITRYEEGYDLADSLRGMRQEWKGAEGSARVVPHALWLQAIKTAVTQAFKGLSRIHSCGLVHGDIKANNFRVDRKSDGSGMHVVITDLGNSCAAGTDASQMPGFSSFTSPEGLEYFNNPGENVVGSASDVFSMGCVLHELLTGLHAFGRDADIHLTHPQWHQHILQRHALWDADLAQNKILPYGLEALREKLPNEKDCWEAEDLLQRMLQIEPSSRPSIEEALDHPFLQGS